MGSHSQLQGIFLTQGSNPSLLHCRQVFYCLRHQEGGNLPKDARATGGSLGKMLRGQRKNKIKALNKLEELREGSGPKMPWGRAANWVSSLGCPGQKGTPKSWSMEQGTGLVRGSPPDLPQPLPLPQVPENRRFTR